MAGRTWRCTVVLAVCGILAAATVSELGAQTKDKVPVNPECGILTTTTDSELGEQNKDKIPINAASGILFTGTVSLVGRTDRGQDPAQSQAVGQAAQRGHRAVRRQGGADARQLVCAAKQKAGRLDRGRQWRGNAKSARHQQQAGVRRLLPARGVLRAAEGPRQQRRRHAGAVRGADPELLRPAARVASSVAPSTAKRRPG